MKHLSRLILLLIVSGRMLLHAFLLPNLVDHIVMNGMTIKNNVKWKHFRVSTTVCGEKLLRHSRNPIVVIPVLPTVHGVPFHYVYVLVVVRKISAKRLVHWNIETAFGRTITVMDQSRAAVLAMNNSVGLQPTLNLDFVNGSYLQ